MSLFRSRKMEFFRLTIPTEGAWEVLHKFGELSSVHFVDSDPGKPMMSRRFSNEIRRCDEALF